MKVLLFAFSLLALSCSNRSEQAKELAIEHLKLTVNNPRELKIVEVSPVDSAFGLDYYTDKEMRLMFETTQSVGDRLMSSTNNLDNLEMSDPALQELFDRQMAATTEMRSVLQKSKQGKGRFSGYKLMVKYEYTSNGQSRKALRWYFIDRRTRHVLKTFELPSL